MWNCEWCDYTNSDPLSYTCEVCGEQSTFHTPPEPKPALAPEPVPEPLPLLIDIPEHKEYSKPAAEVKPKSEIHLTKSTIETALRVARLLIDEAPIGSPTKLQTSSTPVKSDVVTVEPADPWPSPKFVSRVQQPKPAPPMELQTSSAQSNGADHVCFVDPGDINCIICNKPMIFMMIAHLKYPDWLPTGLDEKIELINSMISEYHFYQLIEAINGGAIPNMNSHIECHSDVPENVRLFEEPEFPMNISFVYPDWKTARYRGPTASSLAVACRHATIKNRPVVLSIVIIDALGDESIQLLLITPPEKSNVPIGKVRMINPKFIPSSIIAESLMRTIVDNITMNESMGTHWLFLERDMWIQECGAASRMMYTLTEPPAPLARLRTTRFNAILPLTVASVLASGMELPDVLKLFSDFQYITQAANFIEVALDRIIAFMFKDTK